MQDRGAACQLRPPLCAVGLCVARAGAPSRSLSLGRRRSTRGCRARAPCRAGCGRPIHNKRPLHRRAASLRRCKTVVRRASCGLHFAQLAFASRTPARHCACCLSGVGSPRAVPACARGVPHWLWSPHAPLKAAAPAGGLFPSVQDRGATWQLQPSLCAVGFRVARSVAVSR